MLLATGRLAALGGGPSGSRCSVVALAPLAAGAMIRTHFDLAPVLCLVAGLAAVGSRAPAHRASCCFGVGGALKLFPLAAVPVAAAWLFGRGRRGEAVAGLAIAAVVAGLAVGGRRSAVSADGAREAVEYHVERPVQIESLPASVLNGIEAAGGARARARCTATAPTG